MGLLRCHVVIAIPGPYSGHLRVAIVATLDRRTTSDPIGSSLSSVATIFVYATCLQHLVVVAIGMAFYAPNIMAPLLEGHNPMLTNTKHGSAIYQRQQLPLLASIKPFCRGSHFPYSRRCRGHSNELRAAPIPTVPLTSASHEFRRHASCYPYPVCSASFVNHLLHPIRL